MKASKQKQLNIRSNEAHAIAHGLAKRLGKTTTEVVITALRQLDGRRTIPSKTVTPEEAEANYKMIMEMVTKTNREHPARFSSEDVDKEFYDEFGLPK
jgi:hypothetical protein